MLFKTYYRNKIYCKESISEKSKRFAFKIKKYLKNHKNQSILNNICVIIIIACCILGLSMHSPISDNTGDWWYCWNGKLRRKC